MVAVSGSKALAAFYTPDHVTAALASWAIRDPKITVLDPSFGGCSFLVSAARQLETLGAEIAASQVYGVDIDPEAFPYLDELRARGAEDDQFIRADFFDVSLDNWANLSEKFDVILGNPPYIRYHALPESQRNAIQTRLSEQGYVLSGRTSLWGYFAVRSLAFLKKGGKMALVLPGALLHTDYAQEIQRILIAGFERVICILVRERLFSGTDEESVIFCGTGAGLPNISTTIHSVESASEIGEILSKIDHGLSPNTQGFDWISSVIDPKAYEVYQSLSTEPSSVRLGSVVQCSIGVVTGANRQFILSVDDWRKNKLPWQVSKPIIQRADLMLGVHVDQEDIDHLKNTGQDYLLLDIPADYKLTPSLRRYLNLLKEQQIHLRTKCANRKPWYSISDTRTPPAFFPIMAAGWSRVIINASSATCTNNIARLFWKENASGLTWDQIALGSLSSLAQLSSEIVGRSYGGGVLKVEPREFANLIYPILPIHEIADLKIRVDKLLQHGCIAEATNAVDTALQMSHSWSESTLALIRSARNKLLVRRRGHRNDVSKLMGVLAP